MSIGRTDSTGVLVIHPSRHVEWRENRQIDNRLKHDHRVTSVIQPVENQVDFVDSWCGWKWKMSSGAYPARAWELSLFWEQPVVIRNQASIHAFRHTVRQLGIAGSRVVLTAW